MDGGVIRLCPLERNGGDSGWQIINIYIFRCEYCPRAMKTRLSLSAHLARHRDSKKITCDICKGVYKELSQLQKHMKVHSRQALRATTCRFCGEL